jgi:hypothetical protein
MRDKQKLLKVHEKTSKGNRVGNRIQRLLKDTQPGAAFIDDLEKKRISQEQKTIDVPKDYHGSFQFYFIIVFLSIVLDYLYREISSRVFITPMGIYFRRIT